MAGVGSKSRDVECISSSFSPRGEFFIERSFVSSVSREIRDAPETVIAKADKPTIGRYLRFPPELPAPDLELEEDARDGVELRARRARRTGCTCTLEEDADARIAVIIVKASSYRRAFRLCPITNDRIVFTRWYVYVRI